MKDKPYNQNLIVFALLLLVGALLRLLILADRPFHHDESIHATFAYYWFNNPASGYYKYDPTYHGPFLYSVIRLFYSLFDVSAYVARAVPVFFGLLLLSSVFLFRAVIGQSYKILMAMVAISPIMIYYSRFLVHDMAFLFFAVVFFICSFRFVHDQQSSLARNLLLLGLSAASVGIMLSIKAIAHLNTFTWLSFIAIVWLPFHYKEISKTYIKSLLLYCGYYVAVFFISYSVFQSAFGSHPEAILDGIYRKVLPYWWEQHSIERLKGPFSYHYRNLFIYETPIIVTVLIGLGIDLWKQNKWLRMSMITLFFIGAFTIVHTWQVRDVFPPSLLTILEFFKIRESLDLFIAFICLVYGIAGGLVFYSKGRHWLAFLCYWGFSALMIFSYVGEKGPWLLPHVLFPMMAIAAYYLYEFYQYIFITKSSPKFIKKIIIGLACVCCFLYLRQSIWINYITAGKADEIISQVHNTRSVKDTLELIKEKAFLNGYSLEDVPIAIIGNPVWAFQFHLIENNFANHKFNVGGITEKTLVIITDDENIEQINKKIDATKYKKIQLNKAGWFVPQYSKISLADWISYAWYHESPTPTGYRKFIVLYKI